MLDGDERSSSLSAFFCPSDDAFAATAEVSVARTVPDILAGPDPRSGRDLL